MERKWFDTNSQQRISGFWRQPADGSGHTGCAPPAGGLANVFFASGTPRRSGTLTAIGAHPVRPEPAGVTSLQASVSPE